MANTIEPLISVLLTPEQIGELIVVARMGGNSREGLNRPDERTEQSDTAVEVVERALIDFMEARP